MTYFYNTVTATIIDYNQLKALYPMFGWPVNDNGASVDARLLMNNIHADILQYKRLLDVPQPSIGRYQVAERVVPVLYSTEWRWDWSVRSMTPEEIEIVDYDVIERMKQYRDDNWQNAYITISNGAVLQINERTRRDISDTMDGMMDVEMPVYEGWNAVNGIYNMTIPNFQESRVRGLMRVKKSFDAYNQIRAIHLVTPYEDDTTWQADFDELVEES